MTTKTLLFLLVTFVISASANFLQDLEVEKISQLEEELDDLISDIHEIRDVETQEVDGEPEEEPDLITRISNINERNHPEGVTDVDIKIPPQQKQEDFDQKRNAIFDRSSLWAWKNIGYRLDDSLDDSSKQAILDAHKAISNVSCIKFHKKTSSDKYFLNYFQGSGCWSYVGVVQYFANVGQNVSIGRGCGYIGTCIHETLHALGFFHEQSRYDRDSYVEIFWENITPGREGNFRKLTKQNSDNLETAYDYDGVMHYGKYSFSKNGQPTILAVNDKDKSLGQRRGLSKLDGDQLYKLYDCTNTKQGWSAWSSWTPCSADCKSKRGRFCYSDGTTGDCSGDAEETRNCDSNECKIDGHWGKWSSWSCDASTCGVGTSTRARKCDDPKAQHGGADCVGDSKETRPCEGTCPQKCTFNNGGYCSYTQPSQGWYLQNAQTPSWGTGPTGDVSGNGKYAYYEATGGKEGDKASLQSILFSGNQVKCFRYNYHMFGAHMGTLKISTKRDNGEQLRFNVTGNRGTHWHNGSFDINPGTSFQILIVAVRGNGYQSDIAVDNLFLEDGSCQTSTEAPPPVSTTEPPSPPEVTTSNPQTTSTEAPPPVSTTGSPSPPEVTTSNPQTTSTEAPPTPTFPPSTPFVTTPNPETTYYPEVTTEEPMTTEEPPIPKIAFFCNFEDDLCGFDQSSNDTFDWTLKSGRTRTRSTGPNGDRTAKAGKYMYIESSYRKKGDFAILNSQYGQLSGDEQCLELYYHMYGKGIGELEIFSENSEESDLLFRVTGNQGNQWHQALIPITGERGSFNRLSIRAYVGDGATSDIAIDDVFIHQNECPPGDYKSPTIMSCSFDRTFCEWKTKGEFKWRIRRGSSPTFYTGPRKTIDGIGYYAYAEASQHFYENAKLTSPNVYNTDTMCLRFFYHMYGINIGSLTVSVQTNYSNEVFWEREGSQGNRWLEGMIDLPYYMAYKINIDATIGDGVRSDIAIDNVLVSPGECDQYKYGISSECDFDSFCNVEFSKPLLSRQCESKNGTESLDNGPNSFLYWSLKDCASKNTAYLNMTLKNAAPRGSCLSFDYKIKSSRSCYISINRMFKRGSRMLKARLDNIRDGSENTWIPKNITLPASSTSRHTEQVFIAASIQRYCRFLAVDNIKVSDGVC